MNRLAALAAVVLILGCATKKDPTGGTIVGEVSDPRNRARVHTELAGAYYERGNMGVALDELRHATDADPSYAQAYGLLGLVHMELKETREAESSFERALRLSPNDPDINHNFGWFLCQNSREKESIKYFLQALRNPLYQSPWRTYSAAGVCSMRTNNVKDAEEFFTRALKTRPGDPGVRYQLALIALDQGKADEARQMLESLVRESPQFTEAHVSLSLAYYRLKRPADGKREQEIFQKLTAEAQAKQPGAKPQ